MNEPIGWTEETQRRAPVIGEYPTESVYRFAPAHALDGEPPEVWVDWLTRASEGLQDVTVYLTAEMSESEGAPCIMGNRTVQS